MAGGKQSPRQKMINMMYLVLTALLALNISKDILKALTKIDMSLDQTVQTVDKKNQTVYSSIAALAKESPAKAKEWNDKALQVKAKSEALVTRIESIKDTLVAMTGGEEEDDEGNMAPIGLDNKEKPANYLLVKENGKDLRLMIEDYRNTVASLTKNEGTRAAIESRFNTDPVVLEAGNAPIEWEKANFEHYPLAAILPFLTDVEAKVRNTESDLITEFRGSIGSDDIKVTDVKPFIDAPNYVTQGSDFEAEIFLAAFDATAEPRIVINETNLPADQISGGVGRYSSKATGIGEQKISGTIFLPQVGSKDREVPFTHTYMVAPPSVVISATKMNVLYRGVQNPLDISVPGVEAARVKVSGSGVRQVSPGKYMANVTNITGTKINISVSVEEVDDEGKTKIVPMGKKEFRIKGLPPPQGQIYGRTSSEFAASVIANAPVEAEFKDFPFDLPLTVTSFEVAIPGSPPERIRGNKMNNTVKQRLNAARPGSTVVIRDIKANGPNGLKVKDISPVVIDLN